MSIASNGRGQGIRAALYARVSTPGQTPENQLVALRAFAQARGWEAIEYVDHGISGSKDRRPALDALLAAVRARKVDIVAVTKLDRMARSTRHLVTLAGEFQALGVDLVATDQQVDTTTPSGRLLFHMLAAIAEFERDLIRDRVLAGLQRAKVRGTRSGKAIGRPRQHHVTASAVQALTVGEGLSLRAAARRLGVHHSAVTRALAGANLSRNGVGNPA
jgi:DNA invertase Pin-like site-specific DNA recombinase